MIPIVAILARLRSAGLLAADEPDTDGLTVSGISDDSRQVRAGDLYCAIRGHVHDGHRFLADAAAAGAVAALVAAPQEQLALTQIRVKDSRRAAAIAAQVVYGEPAARLKLVGVTGTNGKTTTVHIARHLLSRQLSTASLGTLGVVDTAGRSAELGLTTPGPVEFARRLAELERGGAECVVTEVSSHALSQGRVDGAEFAVAVFTNLTRDHLDYHSDYEDYRSAKRRLAELLGPNGVLVINADEPAWSGLAAGRRTVSFGLTARADFEARDIQLGPAGSSWVLVEDGKSQAVKLPLLGLFNVANALAAAAVVGALELDVKAAVAALTTVPQVPGRLEPLAQAPLVLRDYAHTPDALENALTALRPLARGRLIAVFGCGGDRDRGKRAPMGRAVAEGADYAIVTSDNPRSEQPESIIDDIVPGLGSAPFARIADRREAIARALRMASPDDIVLLAGKGHETYQVIGDERRPFDEAVIVRELLSKEPS